MYVSEKNLDVFSNRFRSPIYYNFNVLRLCGHNIDLIKKKYFIRTIVFGCIWVLISKRQVSKMSNDDFVGLKPIWYSFLNWLKIPLLHVNKSLQMKYLMLLKHLRKILNNNSLCIFEGKPISRMMYVQWFLRKCSGSVIKRPILLPQDKTEDQ